MSGIDSERFRRDHRWAPSRMSDYLEGALAPTSRVRMDYHLGECEECRRLLAGLRRTVDALSRLSAPSGSVEALAIVASVRVRISRPG
jgi:anti-sigma factor RsiW